MKIQETKGEKLFNVINVLFMISMIVITLYPVYYVLAASFSDPNRMFVHYGALWKPLGFSLESYKAVFKNPNIGIGYRNTLFIVVVGVMLNMIMTILGGYVLSRKYILLRRPISLAIVFTMYFGGGLVPFYLVVQSLGITNTIWSLIIPVAISTYNMMIMRTAFFAIPDEMEESATIDGASQYTLLFRIMVPLVGPTLAVLVLYYAVFHWNTWFNAMLFLRNRALYPLQLVLREILIQNSTNEMTGGASMDDVAMIAETIKYAVIVVSTVPILLLYPFLQRFFVKGVMIGAVKG